MPRLAVLVCVLAACGRIGFDPIAVAGDVPPSGSTTVDLEVPIEMVSSTSLASDATPIDFDRSQTPLRTSDYDGAVTYAFEIVAANEDPPVDVMLVARKTGMVVATISVPNGTVPTRIRTAFTPPAVDDIYSVEIAAASGGYRLIVFDARMIVRQMGATRTRLYIPLVAVDQAVSGDTNGPVNGAADGAMSGTFTQANPQRYALWHKDSAGLATLAAGTPWTFEALLYGTAAGRSTYAALFDAQTGAQVADSMVTSISNQTTADLVAASFAETAGGFVDGHDFEARFAGESGLFNQYLYKAGLWVSLDPLSKGEVLYRVGDEHDSTIGDLDTARALVDLGAFSQPATTFETVGSGGSVALVDAGGLDMADGTPLASLPGSLVTFGPTKTRQRQPITLVSGNRYYARTIDTTTTTAASWIVVGFAPR